jgi:hypothetical protein
MRGPYLPHLIAAVGLSVDEAVALATSNGSLFGSWRGKTAPRFVLTMDLNLGRINLDLDHGRVVAATVG